MKRWLFCVLSLVSMASSYQNGRMDPRAVDRGLPDSLGRSYEFPTKRQNTIMKFGLWARSALKVNDAVSLPAGWIGSDSSVEFMCVREIKSNIYSRGSIEFSNNQPQVLGDINYGTRLTLPKRTAGIKGRIGCIANELDSLMPHFSKISLSPIGGDVKGGPVPWAFTSDIQIEPYDSLVLDAEDSLLRRPPSGVENWTGDVTVKANAKLILTGGYHRFRSLMLEPMATVEIRFDGKAAYIEVAKNLTTKYGSRIVGVGGGARNIVWMVHGSEVFLTNDNGVFQGAVVADSAKVTLSSTARYRGQIFADQIEVHQTNRYIEFVPFVGSSSSLDADGDDLDDSLELALGTNVRNPDTDMDGLSDGLEYWGRGQDENGVRLHRFGAVGALKNGLYLDEDQSEMLNPLRRDALVRFFWEPNVLVKAKTWVTGFPVGMTLEDSLLMLSKHFAKKLWEDSNYTYVQDSAFNFSAVRKVAAHFDLGPLGGVNWPSDVERWGTAAVGLYGGGKISPASGENSGYGMYSWDLPEDPSNTSRKTGMDGKIVWPEAYAMLSRMAKNQRASESFLDLMHLGILVDSRNDICCGDAPGGSFISASGGTYTNYFHELGHTIGVWGALNEPEASQPFFPSVMNYNPIEWGCVVELWDSSANGVRGSWRNQHWCGDDPSVYSYQENDPSLGKFPYMFRSGKFDIKAGWLEYPGSAVQTSAVEFYDGRQCGINFDSLVESDGLGICYGRNRVPLAIPLRGQPIDWNRNGVIDTAPVRLHSDLVLQYRIWGGVRSLVKKAERKNEYDMINMGVSERVRPYGILCDPKRSSGSFLDDLGDATLYGCTD